MPFTAYYLKPDGELQRGLTEDDIKKAFESKQGLLWVDINETTEKDGQFLLQVFNFHPLAIEDCISTQAHHPKVDDFGQYIFFLVHGINHALESDVLETTELDIFLGSNFVVTNHNFPLYSVEYIRQLTEEDGRTLRRGADFLAYSLVDALVDNVMPAIDSLDDIADDIEDEAVRNPQQSTLEAILKFKRSVNRIQRVMALQRDVLNRLSRGEFPIIKNESQIFYRDIYDHIVRIESLAQTLREMADNALTTNLSSVANRQNETMKILSMVAAIFMPLTLIAGIYGMNFENMPELRQSWGYYAVLGGMGALGLSIITLLWIRRIVSWGRQQTTKVRPFKVAPERLLGTLSHLAKKGQKAKQSFIEQKSVTTDK